ncbi:tetratricopeptide repeat-containing glycosyltransferase family 2 protein [Eubacterium oxidoreducens]|uniref:Glycosyltransferase involved in cell wall bisynthesis n=1 Tax=Eubacterium oxidoreducens TaxID=1732 RepID=A0A1G6BSR9_EUBOX|nr:glycosyltransferase family 2 protein [Eubacterium oxidoreducens]SDB23587.1 Glycosyltransferase involved in cell wall bisynthesis [Eubacterium oxidoreducens]
MATISLCMIVKNEEKVLARCLDSIADLMDEIIIVDTGSTDRTKEIAARYTDHIYDFKWTCDFAAARNFSFSKATMEYIYCADADEIIDEENHTRFAHLKQALLPEIEIVQMYYKGQLHHGTVYNYDRELRPKLYRRLRSFRWIEPIHECVSLDPLVFDSDIEILHIPQSVHANRDLAIFESMLSNGQPLSKRLRTFYAKELLLHGTQEHFMFAKDYFADLLNNSEMDNEDSKEAFIILARAYRLLGDAPSFFKYILKNIGLELDCSEIFFELGMFYENLSQYEEAQIWYYNAAFESSAYLNIHFSGDYSLQGLARCYDAVGLTDQAEHYRTLAKQWTPD